MQQTLKPPLLIWQASVPIQSLIRPSLYKEPALVYNWRFTRPPELKIMCKLQARRSESALFCHLLKHSKKLQLLKPLGHSLLNCLRPLLRNNQSQRRKWYHSSRLSRLPNLSPRHALLNPSNLKPRPNSPRLGSLRQLAPYQKAWLLTMWKTRTISTTWAAWVYLKRRLENLRHKLKRLLRQATEIWWKRAKPSGSAPTRRRL